MKINIPSKSLILFQGDSITDMRRSRGVNVNYSLGNGYVYLVASLLGVKCPDMEYRIVNRGIAQDKIEDIEKRWEKDTLAMKPDVVSILAGINNVGAIVNGLAPEGLDKFEQVYSEIVRNTKDLLPDSLLILCEPFSLPVGTRIKNWPKRKQVLCEAHDIIHNIARWSNSYYLRLQTVFEQASLTRSYDYWMFDGVHPTPAGHGLIAGTWLDEIMGITL